MTTPWQLKKSAEFYRELAALLGAGVVILQALRQLHRRPPAPSYRLPLARISRRIEGGSTLTEAVEAERGWRPEFDLALLRAGEESGRLVQSCRALSTHYADRARLVEGFLLKLLYPVFLLHFAVLVFPPDLLPRLFLDGQIGLYLMQKLRVLVPLYGVVFLGIFLVQWRRGRVWPAVMELVLRSVPVLGTARRELALARLAGALEALISAGVNILEAWELSADASASPALIRTIRRWRPQVEAGEPPSELMRRTREFPDLFANLYATGETSGQLDQELQHLHTFYQDSGTRKMDLFALGVSILVTLAVMGTIAYWIVSFWINYYNQLFKSVDF